VQVFLGDTGDKGSAYTSCRVKQAASGRKPLPNVRQKYLTVNASLRAANATAPYKSAFSDDITSTGTMRNSARVISVTAYAMAAERYEPRAVITVSNPIEACIKRRYRPSNGMSVASDGLLIHAAMAAEFQTKTPAAATPTTESNSS
jgi:hypothetical protein